MRKPLIVATALPVGSLQVKGIVMMNALKTVNAIVYVKKPLLLVVALLICSHSFGGSILLETGEAPSIEPGAGFSGWSLFPSQTVGARFELDSRTVITGIGGFIGISSGQIFVALVPLSESDAYPEFSFLASDQQFVEDNSLVSSVFTADDVGDATGGADVLAPVDIVLDAGFYAIILGGIFGGDENGSGYLTHGGAPLDDASIFICNFNPDVDCGEASTNPAFAVRMVVTGYPVPLPASFLVFASALCLLRPTIRSRLTKAN